MKAIIKRSPLDSENQSSLSLDVVVELGDNTKYLDNFLKEHDLNKEEIDEESQQEIIKLIVERAFEEKITSIVEKVVDSLDDNSMLEFGYPDIDVISMPMKFEDLEKSPFHLKLDIPYELIALPMMNAAEKAIESL